MEEKNPKTYLKNLLEFLVQSCQSYDLGYDGEARRLAIILRILLDDERGTPSVLATLGLKDKISYIDESPDYNPAIGLPFSGLAVVTIGKKERKYFPRLGLNPNLSKKADFEKWWTKPVIVDEQRGIRLSRGSILNGTSKSPVGSVNFKLTADYEALTNMKEIVPQQAAESENEFVSVMFASTRQIAYELMRSVEESLTQSLEKNN